MATVDVYFEVRTEFYNIIHMKNSGILERDAQTFTNWIPTFHRILLP
jgi:hypothetical protein